MNKKKVLAVGLASLGIAGVLGSGAALAETGSGSTLAEKIASHFNLNKDEVQKVLDQDRADHQADREKQYEERLQKAVDDKKITSEPRDKILAKQKELELYFESQRDAMKDKTPQERRPRWMRSRNGKKTIISPLDICILVVQVWVMGLGVVRA